MPHPRRAARSGHAGPGVTRADHYAAICAALWAERRLLESLACASVVGRLMASDRLHGWRVDAPSPEEVDMMEKLKLHEVLRAAMVEALLDAAHAPSGVTLAHLVITAPEPWSTMLADHRVALRELLADVESLSDVRQL